MIGKKKIEKFRSWVRLLTEFKLNARLGKFNIDDKVIDVVRLISAEPTTL